MRKVLSKRAGSAQCDGPSPCHLIYDPFRMLIAGVSASLVAIFIRGLTSPARSRLGLPEAAEARPILRSPERRIAQKVPHGASGFPYLTSSMHSFPVFNSGLLASQRS